MNEQPTSRKYDWPALIAEWRGSGLTKSAFCRRNGLPPSGMYAAISSENKRDLSDFSKVIVKAEGGEGASYCVIELPNKVRINLTQPSAALLRAFLD